MMTRPGVTAEFNLNTLVHLNEKLGADFDVGNFEHFSHYNPEQGCIQMFLKSFGRTEGEHSG